jgi:glycosyltransferase involved in cell wall biosynthesis
VRSTSREDLLSALREFCREAHVVFANGRKIAQGAQETFLEQEPQILLNGVDPDKFHPDPTVPRPADYPPGPSVLYSGMVNERLDFELLEKVFPALRQVNFVFVGGMYSHFVPATRQLMERHPNVHFLGHRPVEELFAYLQQADLFMIPSCQDEAWTRAFPANVFEYFMFGKQSVSTFPLEDIPEQYRFAIRVAQDAESFVHQVTEGLQRDSRGEEIAAYGRRQTWTSRAEQVARALGLGG